MAVKANNPCNCPEGYTYIASTDTCQEVLSVPAIYNGSNYTICAINGSSAFNSNGAFFYQDITSLTFPVIAVPGSPTFNLVDSAPSPVTLTRTLVAGTNTLWKNTTGSIGRMNLAGVWACRPSNPPFGCDDPPCGVWVGFSACVNIAETKTYCIAIAADNRVRFKINGQLIVELNPVSTTTFTFAYLHVLPITLQAGLNIIELEGKNDGSNGGFVAEIYDETPAALQAMTTTAQLSPKIVWSTVSQIGNQFQTGPAAIGELPGIGYSCPPGYYLSTCNGLQCVQINTEPAPSCNIVLTSCCGESSVIIPSGQGLDYTNVGQVVCIQDIDPGVGCWTITEVTQDAPTFTDPFTVGSIYADCEDCQTLGCRKCPQPSYIVLKDCCTNLPFTITEGGIDYVFLLAYDGSYTGDNSPSNLNGLGITQFTGIESSISYYGCWYIEEITAIPEESLVYDWKTTMAIVETVPTCKDCSCCTPQYELINCADETETLIVTGDLAQYVGGVIKIQGCADICWKVLNDFECRPCQQNVTVIQDFAPTGGYGKICTYDLPKAPTGAATVTITIDGTTNGVAYSANVYTLAANLTALGLGTFTVNEYFDLVVTGQSVFGPLSIIGTTQTVTTNPICLSGQINNCNYGPVSQGGANLISIVINGITYTSGVINTLSDFNKIIDWLNTLNLGVFTIELVSTFPDVYYISVTGNHSYGLLTLPKPEGTQNYESDCTLLVDIDTACTSCLPPPAPILPVGLVQRFVKPGYTTPGCDPEYTEKVSCNYSDQLYQKMLKDRYGITVCCDPNFEYWLIKKALLEFKQNTPATEELVPPVTCYCYNIAVSAGDINFRYISCEGNLTVVLVSEGGETNVCSQSYPYPICSNSTITGYTITASNTECQTNSDCEPPPAECACYQFESSQRGDTTSYIECNGTVVTDVEVVSLGKALVCAQIGSIVLNNPETSTVTLISEGCTDDFSCAPCTCYEVEPIITPEGQSSISYINCNNEQTVQILTVPVFICAKEGSVTTNNADVYNTLLECNNGSCGE